MIVDKVIISGSRTIDNHKHVREALKHGPGIREEYLVGDARGVDKKAKEIFDVLGNPYTVYDAGWSEHGKAGGPIRNQAMAEEGDALIAVWDGESPGTKNMIETALDEGLHVYVHQVNTYEQE